MFKIKNKSVRPYSYDDLWGNLAVCDLFIGLENDRNPIVILSERPDNKGTSITNMYEHLATKVFKEFLSEYRWDEVTWYEHYPELDGREETFDEVELEWSAGYQEYRSPKWHYASYPEKINELKKIMKQD